MNVLLFAGASDGRELAMRLAALPADPPVGLTVSVATEYGLESIRALPARVVRRAGRLDRAGMERLLRDGRFDVVVDATHPYAREATLTIRDAAAAVGVRRFRLRRERGGGDGGGDGGGGEEVVVVASAEEAAAWLAGTEGKALLATGSKDLRAFAAVPGAADRLYPRVLPTAEALEECARAGLARDHIIAMQGPFSREVNAALMRQYDIRVLVTKDGGAAGGFGEKLAAARDAGVRVLVIARPEDEEGMDADAVLAAVRALIERSTCG